MVTLKTHILVLIFAIIASNFDKQIDSDINKYLELDVVTSKDTVSFNEELRIKVIFRNKTDSIQHFYPKAILYLSSPIAGFEFESLYLNRTLDVMKLQKIEPNGYYEDFYKIRITPSFFKEGVNNLKLIYLCNELKGKLKIYNKLYGSLETTELKLIVTNPRDKNE